MVELVNAVGGSELNEELDLNELYLEFSGDEVRYDPEHWPGLYVRFSSGSPAVMIFRTGKYNIAGADSITRLKKTNEKLLARLHELGLGKGSSEFDVRNLVFLGKYNRELNIGQLAVGLGLENTEYEPEQFPGVLYKQPDVTGTFLIFRSGKVILTGVKQFNHGKSALNELFSNFDALFS